MLQRNDVKCLSQARAFGTTPILLAAERKFSDIVIQLSEFGRTTIKDHNHFFESISGSFEPSYGSSAQDGTTLLHPASKHDLYDLVETLTTKVGCGPNMKGANGNAPTHIACAAAICKVAKTLLQLHEVQIHSATKDGFTPLHSAARSSDANVLELLLRYPFVDLNCKANKGQTLLHAAASGYHAGLTIKFLCCHGLEGNVNSSMEGGITPLHVAAKYSRPDTSRFFSTFVRTLAAAMNKGTQLYIMLSKITCGMTL
jgi:FOG: Ankyrin repeat